MASLEHRGTLTTTKFERALGKQYPEANNRKTDTLAANATRMSVSMVAGERNQLNLLVRAAA